MISHDAVSVSADDGQAGRGENPHSSRPIRVWLVDDNKNFRTLVADLIGAEKEFDCAREFPSAESVLDALARETPPDVILLDVEMGGMSGLDAIRPIKAAAGSTHVVMLTSLGDAYTRFRAMREGASDFLVKAYAVGNIPRHIHDVLECERLAGAAPAPAKMPASIRGEGADEIPFYARKENALDSMPMAGGLARSLHYLWSLLRNGGQSQAAQTSAMATDGREDPRTA